MNRKNENFAVKCIDNIKLKGKHSNLRELILKGCDIGKPGSKIIR